jgi:hypothetical protein
MFSFIKWLQATFSKLKRNKGLWFTTITTISIVGILTAMYYLNTMTDISAEKVYSKAREDFLASLENKIAEKRNFLISNATTISLYPLLSTAIKTKDANSQKLITTYLTSIQENLNTKNGIDVQISLFDSNLTTIVNINQFPEQVHFVPAKDRFSAQLIQKEKAPIVGIEKEGNYVYFRAYAPILLADGSFDGLVEFSQKITVFQEMMEQENKEYLFLLNKTELIDIALRTDERFSKIGDDFAAYENTYNENFYANLKTVDFDELFKTGFFIDENYYSSYRFVEDIEGQVIGVMIFGENTKTSSSVVYLTKDITKSVTTVALALVVSIFMLMF